MLIITIKDEAVVKFRLSSAAGTQQVNIDSEMIHNVLRVISPHCNATRQIEQLGRKNRTTSSYITGVSDVTLSCMLGQEKELVVQAITRCRTRLCSMHIFKNNMLLHVLRGARIFVCVASFQHSHSVHTT